MIFGLFSALSAHVETSSNLEYCACWQIFTVENRVGKLQWKKNTVKNTVPYRQEQDWLN